MRLVFQGLAELRLHPLGAEFGGALEQRQQFRGAQGLNAEIGENRLLPQPERQGFGRQIRTCRIHTCRIRTCQIGLRQGGLRRLGHRNDTLLGFGTVGLVAPLCDTPPEARKGMQQVPTQS